MNKTQLPLVSIVIATYNREQIIIETVQAALDQTYSNTEIIVVDDGSTDGTRKTLSKIDRIKYIYQKNGERGAARNTGIKNSQGEYVVVVDSDDLLEKTMIENCIRPFLEYPNEETNQKALGVVFGQTRYIDTDGHFLGNRYKKTPPQGDVLLDILAAPLLQVTAVVKKECFDHCGLFNEDRSLSGSEDYELWFRIAQKYAFKYVDTPMLSYRIHQEQTASFPKKTHDALMVLHRYLYAPSPVLKDIEFHKEKSLALFHSYTSANYYNASIRKFSLVHYLKAISIYPPLMLQIKFPFLFLKFVIGKNIVNTIQKFYRNFL